MTSSITQASTPWLIAIACSSFLALTVHITRGKSTSPPHYDRQEHEKQQQPLPIPSPRQTVVAGLSSDEAQAIPYPPDFFPGRRDIDTPYGSVRVYEWGPEDGEKVLFVHGISLPCISLGNLAEEFARRGYRVMLFGTLLSFFLVKPHCTNVVFTDLYGRGYSDAPRHVRYDSRLYSSQMTFVVQSSPLNWWTDDAGFHLIGYSLGGGLAVPFARTYPERLRSLTLIASCGLIRPEYIDWQGKLLYQSSLLPDSWVNYLVRRRIDVPEEPPAEIIPSKDRIEQVEQTAPQNNGNGDASGGSSYDYAPISKRRSHVTVNAVLAWQMKHHAGFVDAFTSTMAHAPIYQPATEWARLASVFGDKGSKLSKVMIVLGASDPIILKDEMMEDAQRVLGRDRVSFAVIDSGHEVAITKSEEVAESILMSWQS